MEISYRAVKYFVEGGEDKEAMEVTNTLFVISGRTYLINFYGFGVLNEGSVCIFEG